MQSLTSPKVQITFASDLMGLKFTKTSTNSLSREHLADGRDLRLVTALPRSLPPWNSLTHPQDFTGMWLRRLDPTDTPHSSPTPCSFALLHVPQPVPCLGCLKHSQPLLDPRQEPLPSPIGPRRQTSISCCVSPLCSCLKFWEDSVCHLPRFLLNDLSGGT